MNKLTNCNSETNGNPQRSAK